MTLGDLKKIMIDGSIMNCTCGTKLFPTDIVSAWRGSYNECFMDAFSILRCPKCFKIYSTKNEPK